MSEFDRITVADDDLLHSPSDSISEMQFHSVSNIQRAFTDFSESYTDRTRELKVKKRFWFIVIVALLVLMVSLPVWYHLPFSFEIRVIAALMELNNISSKYHDTPIIVYYVGKGITLLILSSAFIWALKIYNQLRRLGITYRDKAIAANAYVRILNSHDTSCHNVLQEHVFRRLFTPTLIQAEQSASQQDGLEMPPVVEQIISLLKPDKS